DRTIASGRTIETAASASCRATLVAPTPPPSPLPPAFIPTNTAFFDPDHGIVVGSFGMNGCDSGCSGRIETTSDGGRTWTAVRNTKHPVGSVTVFGTSDAWVVEKDSELLRSTDRGRTWTDLGEQVTPSSFVSPTIGFALGHQRRESNPPLLITTNGGRSWRE